jgi:hypothetical protein
MNAVLFNRLLIVGLLVMVALVGFGFYWGAQFLSDQAQKADHAKIDASLKNEDLAQLKRLEFELESKKDIVTRAEQIVAESKEYQYQDQIVRDINSFANAAGVQVLGYNFGAPAQNKKSSKPAGPVSGVNAITANITLKSPLPYSNFMRFLKAIEQNLTKMQVTGINMTPDQEDSNLISNPAVGLIIYVRAD